MKIPRKFTITITLSELIWSALALFWCIVAIGLWCQLDQERTRSVFSKPLLVPMPFTPTNHVP